MLEWSLLVFHPPAHASIPGGILLLDRATDKLYVRVRTDLLELDEDTFEVAALMDTTLEQTASEMGGLAALLKFEQDWSHAFRLSNRQTINDREPTEALREIFEQHVLGARPPLIIKESSPATSPYFTNEDLLLARNSLPLVPATIIGILSALQAPNFNLREIEALVSNDPVLAAHLIKVANSALFWTGYAVRSISEALTRVGAERVELHVRALAIRKAFSSGGLRTVWNHSIEVTHLVRKLCRLSKFPWEEEAVLAALTHDIGQLVLFALGAEFQERFDLKIAEGDLPVRIERALCGISHAEIGGDLLQDWHFPVNVAAAVRNHHQPMRSPSSLACIIHLAEALTDNNEDIYEISAHESALNVLGIKGRDLFGVDRRPDADLQLLSFAAGAK